MHGGIGVKSVSPASEFLLDFVLEQAMNEDHIAADQLFLPAHGLLRDLPVVNDEFEIETWDQPARVAFAGR